MPPRIRLLATTTAPLGALAYSASRGVRCYAGKAKKPAASSDAEKPTAVDDDAIDLNKVARDEFNEWMSGPGRNFKKPLYNEMNYITSYDRKTWQRLGTDKDKLNVPFPLNHAFRSHPVLSEELKEEIYSRVMEGGNSVRAVSAGLGVSLERVAAVARLKAVEKEWIKEGKPIATYLTKALHTMLPVTQLSPKGQTQTFHEGLQDMQSHQFSHRQAFVPVSESRIFTRADAGKEFGLPPTEESVPHPDLIVLQREKFAGLDNTARVDMQRERDRQAMVRREEKERKEKERKEKSGQVIEKGRWAWRLTTATTGRVGFRYGVPHQDRKKGQVKIPTRVL